MHSFDPMAVAIDWLESYRTGDLEGLLDLYDEGASLECGCGGPKTSVGREALRAYWLLRLQEKPSSEFEDLSPVDDGVHLTYRTSSGLVDNLRLQRAWQD